MDLRNFFDLQNVQPNELNGLVSVIDQAIAQAGYEAGGRGIVYGLKVSRTNPDSMAVKVGAGTALFYAPSTTNPGLLTNCDRRVTACRLAAEASIDLSVDYLGASTAVNSGQERWVSLVIRPKTVDSDPRTEISTGNTVYFITTESAELIVVSGYADTVGSAVLHDCSDLGIVVATFLVTNGISVAPAIDLRSREDLVRSVMGGDLTSNANGNIDGYSLVWECKRNESAMGTLRLYLCSGGTGYGPKGLYLAWNAYWNPIPKKWYAATNELACFCVRLGEDGLMVTERTGNKTNGWFARADGVWDKSFLLAPLNGAIQGLMGGGSVSFEAGVAIEGLSARATVGQGVVPPMTCVIQFPCYIPAPRVAALSTAFESDDHAIQGGSAVDLGVSTVAWYITNTFAICKVTPTAIDTYVRYNRKVTISNYDEGSLQ